MAACQSVEDSSRLRKGKTATIGTLKQMGKTRIVIDEIGLERIIGTDQ